LDSRLRGNDKQVGSEPINTLAGTDLLHMWWIDKINHHIAILERLNERRGQCWRISDEK